MGTITPSVAGGNWSATGAWTLGVVPTAADDVVFHAGAGNITVDGTSGSPSLCRSLDLNTFSYAGTLTMGSTAVLTIGDSAGGSMTMPSTGLTFAPNATSKINFVSTTTGNTITTGGHTYGAIVFNGSGGGWTLQDAFKAPSAGSTVLLTLTAGTLDTNGQTITNFNFSGASGATLTLGATAWNARTLWSANSGMTLNANTSTITVSTNTIGNAFAGGGLTYNNVTLSPSLGGTIAITGANVYATLTLSPTSGAAKTSVISIPNSATQTCTNLTCTGNSAANRFLFESDLVGTAATVSCSTTVSVTHVDFQDITAAGAASWDKHTSTNFGDAGGNTGIAFTTAQTNFYQTAVTDNFSTTAKWFLATNGGGGAGRIPLPQDTGRFDANSVTAASKTVTQDMPRMGSINWTSVANSPVCALGTNSILGSTITFTSAMSVTGTLTTAGRGTQTLTCGALTLLAVTANGFGGTLTLADTFASSATVTLTQGTFDAATNNVTVTSSAFVSSNSNTRTLKMGSAKWTLNGTGTIWNTGTTTGLTISNSTGTIELSDTSASAKTFTSGGISMTGEGIQVDGAASAGIVTFSGAMSIANMAWQANCSIKFTINTTYTVTGLSTTASSGNTATIASTTASTKATISCANNVDLDWLVLTDNTATNNIPFYAGPDSTLLRTSNWSNTNRPAGGVNSNFFMFM